jgi:hypothetical protein
MDVLRQKSRGGTTFTPGAGNGLVLAEAQGLAAPTNLKIGYDPPDLS